MEETEIKEAMEIRRIAETMKELKRKESPSIEEMEKELERLKKQVLVSTTAPPIKKDEIEEIEETKEIKEIKTKPVEGGVKGECFVCAHLKLDKNRFGLKEDPTPTASDVKNETKKVVSAIKYQAGFMKELRDLYNKEKEYYEYLVKYKGKLDEYFKEAGL